MEGVTQNPATARFSGQPASGFNPGGCECWFGKGQADPSVEAHVQWQARGEKLLELVAGIVATLCAGARQKRRRGK